MRLWIVAALLLVTTAPAFGQATSTFNGRVLDQGDAVLPGVTVTATNVSTGVSRSTSCDHNSVSQLPCVIDIRYALATAQCC